MYYCFKYEDGFTVRFGRAYKSLTSALRKARDLGWSEVHDQKNRCIAAFRNGAPIV